MLRRLFADSIIYSVASAIPGIAALVMLPIYTRFLQPKDYGAVDLVTFAYAVVAVIATLEIHQGLARYLPAAEKTERRRLSSTAFWFTFVMMTVAVCVLAVTAPQISDRGTSEMAEMNLWRVGGAAALSGAISGLAMRQLRWSLRASAYVLATTVSTIATAIVTLSLLVVYEYGAAALLFGQAAGSAAGFLLAWRLAEQEIGWTFKWSAATHMIRFSLPLVASTIGILAASQASRWIVAYGSSLEQAGLFSVASRIAGIIGLGASGVQLALAPIIYASYRNSNARSDLVRSFRVFWAAGLVLWASLTLFGKEILAFLVAPSFHDAAPLIGPIAAAVLLMQTTVFAPGLELANRTGSVAVIGIVAGILNLLLGWICVSYWGAIGAAAAMCASAVVHVFFTFRLSQRYYEVPHPWRRYFCAVVIAIFVTVLGSLVPSYVPWFDALFRTTLIGLLGFVCWSVLVSAPRLA